MRGSLLLWPAWNSGRTSVRPSAVHVAVLRSARHRIRDVLLFGPSRHTRRSFVLPSEAFGMRGGLPPCPAWLSVCAADFLHAWRSSLPARCGHRYARRSSILARHGRRFVWRSSTLRGMRGGLLSCPAQLPVCAADFLHAQWSSVLPGAVHVAVFRSTQHGYRCTRPTSFVPCVVLRVRHRWSQITCQVVR